MALPKLKRSTRGLLLLVASIPVTVLVLALLYMAGMHYLEGEPRSFLWSIEWAAETLTTTGYGADANWNSPLMVLLVRITSYNVCYTKLLRRFERERAGDQRGRPLPGARTHLLLPKRRR